LWQRFSSLLENALVNRVKRRLAIRSVRLLRSMQDFENVVRIEVAGDRLRFVSIQTAGASGLACGASPWTLSIA
jgi:hypothetical protein